MLKPTLSILKEELIQYLTDLPNWTTGHHVNLANVTQLDYEDTKYQNDILISLINTELDKVMRNTAFNQRKLLSDEVVYRNPKVSLNLYVLFSAKFDPYEEALEWLSKVIEFFQSKNVFTAANTPAIKSYESLSENQKMNFKIIVDLHSLSLEQLNNLWGTLGRNLMPHILYKIRLVQIFSDQVQQSGSVITEINSSETIL